MEKTTRKRLTGGRRLGNLSFKNPLTKRAPSLIDIIRENGRNYGIRKHNAKHTGQTEAFGDDLSNLCEGRFRHYPIVLT